MRNLVLLLLSGLILVAGASTSLARDWIVDRVSGTVWSIEEGREPVKIERQMHLRIGATIQTLGNGRIRLVSAKNSITMSPNSLATIARGGWLLSPRTRVLQEKGTIEFEVETRSKPHFEVKTPYLAAVVKGTKFTVSVTASSSSVAVVRGLVGVTDTKSGETADVGAGQKASAGAADSGLSTSAGYGIGQIKSNAKAKAKAKAKGKSKNNATGSESSGKGSGNSGKGNSNGSGNGGNSSGNGNGGNSNGSGNSGRG